MSIRPCGWLLLWTWWAAYIDLEIDQGSAELPAVMEEKGASITLNYASQWMNLLPIELPFSH